MFSFLHSKKSLQQREFFHGYTDYHCHLLYGVDDGSESWGDTEAMLKTYEELGITKVWLTPHVMEDYPNTTAQLQQRFGELCAAYRGPIVLHLAAEYMICPVLTERIRNNDLLTIGEKGMHVLVETSYFDAPLHMDQTLDLLRSSGYIPIMAHPERSEYMTTKMMEDMRSRGIKFQLDLFSICGAYSPTSRMRAEKYLKAGYYDLVGTDTHSNRFLQFFAKAGVPNKLVNLLPEQSERL